MGWYIYPHAPGTEYGPCDKPCKHIDCTRSRLDSMRPCRICGQPIGYENRVYFEGDATRVLNTAIVHADCLEREVEMEKVAPMMSDTEWNAFSPSDKPTPSYYRMSMQQTRPYMARGDDGFVVFADLSNHRFISRFRAPSIFGWSRYAPLQSNHYNDPIPMVIRDFPYSPHVADRPTPTLTWKRVGDYVCNEIAELKIMRNWKGLPQKWLLIYNGERIASGPTLAYVKQSAQTKVNAGYIV